MIKGFFKNGAGFINAHLISQEVGISEIIEFLVDTGASRTTLLDKDVIYLGIDYGKLRKSEPAECEVIRINEQVAINIGLGEKVVGIEILDASQLWGGFKEGKVELENVTPVK